MTAGVADTANDYGHTVWDYAYSAYYKAQASWHRAPAAALLQYLCAHAWGDWGSHRNVQQ